MGWCREAEYAKDKKKPAWEFSKLFAGIFNHGSLKKLILLMRVLDA